MQTDLRSRAEKMKNKLIKHKAGVISTTASYNEDHVNQKLSFIGSPNEQMLFAQVHDPNANWEELGITAFWDDNDELNYTYNNQIQKEYDSSSEVVTPSSTISHSKLASMMVLKDIKGNNDANALLTKAGTMSSETIGKTKSLAHKDWSRVKSSIYNDYYSLFMNKENKVPLRLNYQHHHENYLTLIKNSRYLQEKMKMMNALFYLKTQAKWSWWTWIINSPTLRARQ